jgi:hypothetical protein
MNDDFLNITDALKLVQDPSTDTQAPARVEQVVWLRIARLNQLALFLRHHSRLRWKISEQFITSCSQGQGISTR